MTAVRVLGLYNEARDQGGDTSALEMAMSNIIGDLLDVPDFYKIPISSAEQIFNNCASYLSENQTKKALDGFMKINGLEAMKLLKILNFKIDSATDKNECINKKFDPREPENARSTPKIQPFSKTNFERRKPTPPISKKTTAKLRIPHYMTPIKSHSLTERNIRTMSTSLPNFLSVSSPSCKNNERSPRTMHSKRVTAKNFPVFKYTPEEIAEEERHNRIISLFVATEENDFEKVKEIIEKNKDVVNEKVNDETLLHVALRKKNIRMASLLIRNGADINSTNSFGSTPLYNAIYEDDIDCMTYVISLGADIRHKNNKGNTPLHWAVQCHKPRACKLLISSGAEIDAQNDDGETPIFIACSEGQLEAARELFNADADYKIPNKYGETAEEITVHPNIKEIFDQKNEAS